MSFLSRWAIIAAGLSDKRTDQFHATLDAIYDLPEAPEPPDPPKENHAAPEREPHPR